jgi:predicted TIM-barrel fold metal-dependent hydrolase
MDLSQLARLPIIDCHTHCGGEDPDAIDVMLEKEKAGGVDQLCVLVTSVPGRANGNAQGFAAKAKHPDKVYLMPGMDYSAVWADVDHRWTRSFPRQIDRLIAMGCDGLKMINGKPNCRKDSGIALDSVLYRAYFAKLAETGFPVLWHVNDPEEFWDPAAAPEWARGPGWLYDDSYPTNQSLYDECERVLAAFPTLKIIFAHFYFLSDFLDPRPERSRRGAAALLDRYPNVHLDLAPGIEMLHNFSKRPQAARDFFLKYQDRIVFGTDFSPRFLLSRIWVVRNFLETDETFHVPTDDHLFWPDHRTMITGIKLPETALRKIYAGNYRRIVGPQPKPLNLPLVIEELDRLALLHDSLGVRPNMPRKVAEALTQGPPSPEEED